MLLLFPTGTKKAKVFPRVSIYFITFAISNQLFKMTRFKPINKTMAYMRKTVLLVIGVFLLALSVDAQTPRPEYPRPQFERQAWVNLNGQWSYAFDFGNTGVERKLQDSRGFDKQITVPFCPESKLSGVGYTDFIPCMWYQRGITVPQEWQGRRICLNFGAVDYESHVYIDGKLAGSHYGSGSSFAIDITKFVKAGGSHNLVVRVVDNLRDGRQTGGKQSSRFGSYGCFYTRTTGIWQTVWLEAVDEEGLESVYAVPDIDQRQLVIHPRFYHQNSANTLTVTLLDGRRRVATASVPCSDNDVVVLPVKGMKLWSPESPFLYDVVYEVKRGGKVVDRVKSYAGMRKVSVEGGRFLLNNKPFFQRLVLDQGYYPDGIWTAPGDEALKNDILLSQAAGFNGARLHQKSFEERYYYWADKLGYLTWSESASWGLNVNDELAARNFISEWAGLVARDRNHPSIVTWTPFNETWDANDSGVYTRLVEDVYDITKAIDGTRPVNDASGDGHVKTDIWSVHDYERDGKKLAGQLTFHEGQEPYRNMHKDFLANYDGQPYMIDEFGGLPWYKPDGNDAWGYGDKIGDVETFYSLLKAQVEAIKSCPNVVGFCYTQLTDVEQEKNGIYYYDRKPKFDMKRIKSIFEIIPSY